MKRPVHYRAAFNALAFACYWREMDAHLGALKRHEAAAPPATGTDWYKVRKAIARTVTAEAPSPLRHTGLKRVTCSSCWGEIAALARIKLGVK
jgi:hypothetical protein